MHIIEFDEKDLKNISGLLCKFNRVGQPRGSKKANDGIEVDLSPFSDVQTCGSPMIPANRYPWMCFYIPVILLARRLRDIDEESVFITRNLFPNG